MDCAKSPEDELKEFLTTKPSWLQKFLQLEYSWSPDEISAWQQSEWWWKDTERKVENEYLRLLQRCPAKWREYLARRKQLALLDVPQTKRGRPRTSPKDDADILALEEGGLNREQIAKQFGITKEAVSKRLKVAKLRIPPQS